MVDEKDAILEYLLSGFDSEPSTDTEDVVKSFEMAWEKR